MIFKLSIVEQFNKIEVLISLTYNIKVDKTCVNHRE